MKHGSENLVEQFLIEPKGEKSSTDEKTALQSQLYIAAFWGLLDTVKNLLAAGFNAVLQHCGIVPEAVYMAFDFKQLSLPRSRHQLRKSSDRLDSSSCGDVQRTRPSGHASTAARYEYTAAKDELTAGGYGYSPALQQSVNQLHNERQEEGQSIFHKKREIEQNLIDSNTCCMFSRERHY